MYSKFVQTISFPRVLSGFSLSRNQQTAPLPPSSTFLCFVSLCLHLFFRCLGRSTRQTWKSWFCFFKDSKQHKGGEIDMITLRNHAPQSDMTRLSMTLSVLDMIIVKSAARWRYRHWFRKFTVRFRAIRKEIVTLMYNNCNNSHWNHSDGKGFKWIFYYKHTRGFTPENLAFYWLTTTEIILNFKKLFISYKV